MNKYLTFSSGILLFILGVGIGFAFTPEYARMRMEKNSSMVELGSADRYIDLRYMNNMIAHHLIAIDMSKQALNKSKREEIKTLANTIIDIDEKGIDTLYSYKKQMYQDTKAVTKYSKVILGDSDELFDLRLINALISHHDEAIESAKEMRGKSVRTEILNLADSVIESLSANKKQLQQWRASWYGVESQ